MSTHFETKYELGSSVVGIEDRDAYKIVGCETCLKKGRVQIGPEEFVCPNCQGKSAHPRYVGRKWIISTSGSVGQITIEAIDPRYGFRAADPVLKIEYMLTSTGVGSGRMWSEDNLFGCREIAQMECDKRNGVLDLRDECEMKAALI